MGIKFEAMTEAHLGEVTGIYNYYVLNSTATFHTKPMSSDEMKDLVFFDSPLYKTFIIKRENEICGYCILTQFRKREAYDITAEVTVYLKDDCTARGIGSVAVKYIEDLAKEKGIHVLVASITGDNYPSLRLFEKNGYEKCAYFKEVGVKFDRLLDLVYLQKIL
jgi:L-amino acid N-acyltransferase YncA